ncbi:MAG TPA: alpha/beta hydrolase [Galbitalea sp.]|nr:alpha/beta hydrolase [Galbitalea sp.]
MNWFGRHVSTRVVDYAWAYRLRLMALDGRDAVELRDGERRPVLLLPGVYETWHFLEAVGSHLHSLGHPVHVVPEFGRNLRPIREMAELAQEYLVAADLRNVAIVAHSKGGLIGKTLMLAEVQNTRIAAMVAINTPFAGSDYAHLVPIRTLREFVPTHETIVNLTSNAEVNAHIVSIFSSWDPIIPNGSVLAGAVNVELPVTGHFRILDRPDLLDLVARAVAGA